LASPLSGVEQPDEAQQAALAVLPVQASAQSRPTTRERPSKAVEWLASSFEFTPFGLGTAEQREHRQHVADPLVDMNT
jgi:hypothetical protein